MELTTPEFKKAYNRLNKEQKEAVDSIEGPVMVVAGPGTGKTQVLATRIANILLKTDEKPYNILALTFTESAAKNMRERIVSLIGKTGYYVQISTFHAFCSEVIQSHPEYFPIDRGSEPLTDLERYDLFRGLIHGMDLEVLKPLNRNLFFIKEIMWAISMLKREGVTPEEFEKIVAADLKRFSNERTQMKKAEISKQVKNLKKQQELLRVYYEHENKLRELLRYDFDDMVSLVVQAFKKHELLLREYQENIHYFLVDEYQDTNTAQNEVADLLASYWEEQPNLFVVGDPHQSIFRFQGASVENMLGFMDKYQQAKVVTLATGYRCPQVIYDAAHESIGNNELTNELSLRIAPHKDVVEQALNKKLASAKETGVSPVLYKAPSQTVELIYTAEKIKELLGQGVKAEEIAILYHNNVEVEEVQQVLEKWQIPYAIDGGINILETEEIRQLLELFRVIKQVRTAEEDINLYETMCFEWVSLDNVLVMRVARAAGRAKKSIIGIVDAGYESFKKHEEGNGVTKEQFASLELFIDQLRIWGSDDARLIFPEWAEKVINESGYLPWVMSRPQKIELLMNLNSLYREIKALAHSNRSLKLDGFLEAIDVMLVHNISLQAEDLNVTEGAVHLSTVHKAKGREWDYVFLIHCLDGRWGNARKRDLLPLPAGLVRNTDLSKKERNEDERRLFYVAITRAKKELQVSYPETLISDNRSKDVFGSMFIEEISGHLKEVSKNENLDFLNESERFVSTLLQPVSAGKVSISEEEFFSKLVKNFKFSATSLNTYLKNPEDFVTNVLLRVPRAKSAQMAFGTAVHKSLENFYLHLQRKQERQGLPEFLDSFAASLSGELLVAEDLERRLAHGKSILANYYEKELVDPVAPLYVERFFGSGMNKAILDDIQLSGRIDRVDWIDKQNKFVKVVDYKTGGVRSVGDIEGKTVAANLSPREKELPESIRGSYKRQLLFYKLLAELDQTFTPVVTEGEFDFIEPNKSNGKLVRRSFELRDEDVDDLKELIRTVAKEVRELRFLELINQAI